MQKKQKIDLVPPYAMVRAAAAWPSRARVTIYAYRFKLLVYNYVEYPT